MMRIFAILIYFLCFAQAVFSESPVRVVTIDLPNNNYSLQADNSLECSVTIRLDFPLLSNLVPSVPIPATIIVPAKAKNFPLINLKPERKGATQYKFSYNYTLGDPRINPDNFTYSIPLLHGSKAKISQGNNGAFTHKGDQTFAFDFNVPVGTEVHAARAGYVVQTKSDSDKGGATPEYDNLANYIIIAHEDGTFGHYLHLKKDGILVQVGEKIKLGQTIGFSGNTGRSTGPHLHFMVTKAHESGRSISVPIAFYNYSGMAFLPLEGDYVYAYLPGESSFPVLLGSELNNEDFSTYSAYIDAGKIEVRSETIDDTTVLYGRNPTGKKIVLSISLTLVNLKSSKDLPFVITLNPRTEAFLLLLKPIKPNESYSFTYSFRYKSD